MKIKVLSYNIHKGFNVTNRRFVLTRMREALHEAQADVLLIQEIVGENKKHADFIAGWPDKPQLEYLAAESYTHCVYGKNRIYPHGHHGNAVISKFPIAAWHNLDLSTNRLESRGALCTQLLIGDASTVDCITLHLNLLGRSRKKQLARLCKHLRAHLDRNIPLIVGGDFNDWRGYATDFLSGELGLEDCSLSRHGRHARTYPSNRPTLPLDRIYYRGLKLVEVEVLSGSPWKVLSDHLPITASFRV